MHGFLKRRRNPLTGKRLVHLAGFKPRGSRPAVAVVGADGDAPEIACARRKCQRKRTGERVQIIAFSAVVEQICKRCIGGGFDAGPNRFRTGGFRDDPAQLRLVEPEAKRRGQVVDFQAFNFHQNTSILCGISSGLRLVFAPNVALNGVKALSADDVFNPAGIF